MLKLALIFAWVALAPSPIHATSTLQSNPEGNPAIWRSTQTSRQQIFDTGVEGDNLCGDSSLSDTGDTGDRSSIIRPVDIITPETFGTTALYIRVLTPLYCLLTSLNIHSGLLLRPIFVTGLLPSRYMAMQPLTTFSQVLTTNPNSTPFLFAKCRCPLPLAVWE